MKDPIDGAGLWYEDSCTGQPVPWARIAAAQAVEAAYCAATLGLGSVLSLALRCCAVPGAAFGERVSGIHLVQERSEKAH